jgi:hypothetical protein
MFFRPVEDLEDQHVTWRQVRFGELLFNLQHLDRFEERQAEWHGDQKRQSQNWKVPIT